MDPRGGGGGAGGPQLPSCQPQGGSPGTKRASGPGGPRAGWGAAERGRGHLPSSSTFFPAGSLERERVETSLRMQDLTGSKTHTEPGLAGLGVGATRAAARGCGARTRPRRGRRETPAAQGPGRRARAPAGTGSRGGRRAGRTRGDPARGGVVTTGSARPRRRPLRRRRCPTRVRGLRVRPCKWTLIPAGRNRRSRLALQPPSWSGISPLPAQLNERGGGGGVGGGGNPDMERTGAGRGLGAGSWVLQGADPPGSRRGWRSRVVGETARALQWERGCACAHGRVAGAAAPVQLSCGVRSVSRLHPSYTGRRPSG